MDVAIQQLLVGLSLGSIYALIALGYSLVFSTMRVVNFAQGHLVMLSSLIVVTLWVDKGWPVGLAILTSTVIVAVVALLLERAVSLQKAAAASPLVWIITTLGAAIVIENVAAIIFGKDPKPFPHLVPGPLVRIGGAAVTRDSLLAIVVALALMGAIDLFLKRSIWGKAVMATAYSPWVPRLMGVPVGRVIAISFALSGAIAGVTGALMGPVFKDASSNLGLQLGLLGFIAVVIGGMGSTVGALVGGLSLGVLQTVLRGQLPPGAGTAAIFLALIVLLVLRPSGLFGRDWGRQATGSEGLA
ncbi:MAG: branched-chain amino acid ABC transporter permease [Actinomycetota bacterium]